MKKWMLSAIFYLTIVVAGYLTYDAVFGVDKIVDPHGKEHDVSTNGSEEKLEKHESHANVGQEEHSEVAHEHGKEASTENEVNVTVREKESNLVLTLKDTAGKPVNDLKINHEKRLHLIVVDEHLEEYYHLHPEEVAPGQFEVAGQLKEGNYKAFVDLKSTSLKYEVQPIPFTIGDPASSEHTHGSLKIDEQLVKIVDGNKVTLTTTDLVANKPVTLTFNVHDAELEPYLGAMGHVVIIDEQAEDYLHVHPLNEQDTAFETQFSQPGVYKIWAEFQQDGKVTAYPFVINVK